MAGRFDDRRAISKDNQNRGKEQASLSFRAKPRNPAGGGRAAVVRATKCPPASTLPPSPAPKPSASRTPRTRPTAPDSTGQRAQAHAQATHRQAQRPQLREKSSKTATDAIDVYFSSSKTSTRPPPSSSRAATRDLTQIIIAPSDKTH